MYSILANEKANDEYYSFSVPMSIMLFAAKSVLHNSFQGDRTENIGGAFHLYNQAERALLSCIVQK